MLKKLAVLLIISALFIPFAPAKADIAISPLRVVFKGRDRSAVVSLINLSDRVNTYRVGWTLYKMKESGGYEPLPINVKDPHAVNNMVIFSPRQVVIRPDQHQLIRLSLRRPADLPVGEYRGHLTLTRLPPSNNRQKKDDKENLKGQSLALQVHVTFSIPVIVRSGADDDLKVTLSDPKFETVKRDKTMQPVLNLNLDRVSGKFSTYGSINVFWTKPGQPEKQIGILNNIALYPEINRRKLQVPLNTQQVGGGTIRVLYKGKYESEGTIWDEKIFPVGG